MQLIINDLAWTVKLAKRGDEQLKNSDGQDCFGTTDFGHLMIALDDSLSITLLSQIVTHELAHAYIFSYGYHISDEEGLCDFIGSQFNAIAKDRQKILKWAVGASE